MSSAHPTVLMVEDDANDVALFQRALWQGKLFYIVHQCEDGEKAIEYLSGTGIYADRTKYPLPMLVLLDLKIALKSGFEVLDWIRSQPDILGMPVIVLTSSKQEEDVKRAFDLGANSYLVKPSSFKEFRYMVDTFVAYWKMNELHYGQPREIEAMVREVG